MKKNRLGILVFEHKTNDPPFHEELYHRHLCQHNDRIDLETFVFSPNWVHWLKKETLGYTYDAKEKCWKASRFPLPDLIYDRSFYRRSEHVFEKRKFNQFLRLFTNTQYLGHCIQNKWDVYRLLKSNRQLEPYLPYTEPLHSFKQLTQMLSRKKEIIIKPVASSQGKGILHLSQTGRNVEVRGRDGHNRIIHARFQSRFQLYQWLKQEIGRKKYCLQSALSLTTSNKEPFDLRVLIQKNQFGRWKITGSSIRLGRKNGVTSNLHGGGKALETSPFLLAEFGAESRRIWREVESICRHIPKTLEARYGRLVELGIDLGIDRQGKLWILEVNAKPGRSAFRHHQQTLETVTLQPVLYAKYLLKRQFRRVSQ